MADPSDKTPAAPLDAYVSNPLALLGRSWHAFTLNFITLLRLVLAGGGVVIGFGIFGLLVAVLLSRGSAFAIGVGALVAIAAICAVLVLIFYGQYIGIRIVLASAAGAKISLREAVPELADVRRLIKTDILAGLAILGGFALFIIPGIIFSVWFGYATYATVAEGLEGRAALGRSRAIVRGRFWDAAATLFLSSAAIVAQIVPVLGIIVSIALGILIIPLNAIRYRQLVALGEDKPSMRTSPWVFIILIMALIGTGINIGSTIHNAEQRAAQHPTTKVCLAGAGRIGQL